MNGVGAITGTTVALNGSRLSPGNSPGQITVDDLILSNGSTTDMEIETTTTAGVNYDQIVINNSITVEDGAMLNIIKYGNGVELEEGEKAKIFDFTPGKISGYFSNVTSTYTNNLILNLATGEVVGLGGHTISGFENSVALNSNISKLVSALKVNETDGVAQYYGGEFVSRLASNQGNVAEIKKIYERFSPEAYTGLLEQVKFDMLNVSPEAPTNLDNIKSGLTLSMNKSVYNVDRSDDYVPYEINDNSINITYTEKVNDGILMTSFTAIDGAVKNDTLNSSTKEYALSLATVQPLMQEGLTFRAHASYIQGNIDVSRTTYNSQSTVKGIDSYGIMGGIGMGAENKVGANTFVSSLDVIGYQSHIDKFQESNTNFLDSLDVMKQKEQGIVSKAKIEMTSNVTDALDISINVKYNKFFNSKNNNVSAKLINESSLFTVENEGIGNDIIGSGISLDYKIAENLSTKLNAEISGNKELTQNKNFDLKVNYYF